MNQKVSRLVPQTANPWQYVNAFAMLSSRERRHSACRVASLCEQRVAQHKCLSPRVPSHLRLQNGRENGADSKFCVKLSKSGAETFQMKRRAYGNEAMSRARCFERSGRPSMSSTPKNVETIRRLVHEDRRRTIKDIAAIVNVSHGTVQTFLTCDLNMYRVAAKFVPRLLTPEQKEHLVTICQELRQRALDDPSFMSSVITGDESWVYGYDPEIKQQPSQWKSPGSQRMKKARQSRSATKSMLIGFFDIRGIVHLQFAPEG